MILDVQQIKEGLPKKYDEVLDREAMDLEFVDFHYQKPITLKGEAERIRQTITFRGTISTEVEQICARCLESVAKPLAAPFEFSYAIETQETIDTTDDLRDVLILTHPDRFLCQTNCKGICQHCGVNLNHNACRCK